MKKIQKFDFLENILVIFFLFFLIFLSLNLLIFNNESWYHIESLMSFVNSNENTKVSIWEIILRGTFFDDNPARFRPLSHIVEFIDNYSKLFLFNISIENTIFNTLSNYFFIFFSFYVLFNIFKQYKFSIISCLFLLLLTFSFTSFLGSFYFSFRPAKKIVILLSFFAFLNFLKYKKNQEEKYLYYSYFYNLLLLISDEEGWYISCVFFYFYLFDKDFFLKKLTKAKKEWVYINIISFISIITYTIIWPRSYFNNLYSQASVIQQIPTLIQFEKFKLYFNSILENFFSGFFGLSGKYSLIIYLILSLIFIYFFFNLRTKYFIKKVFITIFLILGFVTFNTCLELIGGNIIMRSLGYYYGSSKIILLFFIVFIFIEDFKIKKNLKKYSFLFYITVTIIIFFNIQNFLNINTLIKNIHFENIQYKQFYYNFNVSQKARIENNCNYFLNNFKKFDMISYKEENFVLLKKVNMSNQYNIELLSNYDVITSKDNLQFFFNYFSGCKFLLQK